MNDYALVRHDVALNTEEWLELRKNYRTASEAAIVLGISPFQTPINFKLIKAGLKKQYYSAAMRQGHELEAQVRQHAGDHFDLNFEEQIWTRGKYLASLDGIDGDVLVELKVSDRTYNDLAAGNIPEYYYAQVQQQLYCSPATVGYIYAYSPKRDAYICSAPIEELPMYMDSIAEAWDAFDKLEIDEHTPVDRSDDGAIVNLFAEYAGLMTKIKQCQARADIIKAKLIEEANDHTLIAGDFKLERRKGATRYDYKKAATDAKVDLEQYKTEGAATFTFKLPKNPFEVLE